MFALSAGTPHSIAFAAPLGESRGAVPTPLGEIFSLSPAKILAPRILVVDDEGLLRWSLAEMLSAAGYEVIEARNGKEARQAFGTPALPVAAMLLDLKLPDANGIQLLQEARRNCLTCPIIVMTAYGTADTVEAAMSAGAHHVVSKPFDLDHMVRLVRQLCPLAAH